MTLDITVLRHFLHNWTSRIKVHNINAGEYWIENENHVGQFVSPEANECFLEEQ
jgi:hypothetical protein